MKLLILMTLLTSTMAFATESKTDCPWMKDSTLRANPKATMVVEQEDDKKEEKRVLAQ